MKLPNGIPSHDTFGRVFGPLDPEQFSTCFMDWVRSVSDLAQGEVVAIDDKTLRGCHDRANGRGALHMVSTRASEHRMVLRQTRTEAHSNEITAIPELLKVLELKGCLVPIHAMGCHRNIAQQVVQGGADYLLAVKDNQGESHQNIKDLFACCERVGWNGVAYSHHEQVGKDHGRLERRQRWVINDPEELAYVDSQRQWANLGAVARVSYRRDATTDAPTDTRYYICSFPADAATLLASARSHWSIENSLHWVLDVAFDEDHSRVRTGHVDQNLAVIRHLALNLLNRERSAKVGIKAKRKKSRLGLRLPAQSPITMKCDCPETPTLERRKNPAPAGSKGTLIRTLGRAWEPDYGNSLSAAKTMSPAGRLPSGITFGRQGTCMP